MTRRPAMPVPEVISAEMQKIVRMTGELADLAQVVGDAYEDLYDAAFRQTGGSGHEKPIGRGNFSDTDPTGDVAVSGLHKRLRWRAHSAAKQLRRCTGYVEQAENIMAEAWAEQDPEFQEKLRRLRQLENEIEGQTELGGAYG